MSHRVLVPLSAGIFLLLSACSSDSVRREPALAQAFVGPVSVNLREQIALKSPVVTTVKHGDEVDILDQKRRFVRVRARNGKAGWTEARQLMTADEMNGLRRLADQAAALPSQGTASSYEPLNMHSAPDRNSPGFYQIHEGIPVEVLAHKLSPKLPIANVAPPRLIPPRPKPVRKKRPEDDSRRALKPPPAPAPGLPQNWVDLSKTEEPPEPEPKEPEKPVVMEDWSLVRLKDGAAGWVLTRMLNMAIPDEVAQYSEGHRITSYFAMMDIEDQGQTRHQWLWTTLSKENVPYDFDSYRYFIWSRNHHRYETAYIERKVIGYFPVIAQPGATPKFTLIMQGDDGKLYRYHFIFDTYRVRLVSKEPWTPPPAGAVTAAPAPVAVASQPAPSKPGLFSRLRNKVRSWMGKR